MEEHFLEGKPLTYQHSYKNNFAYTLERRKLYAKVIDYMLKNPFESFRSVARKFWIHNKTVSEILNKYPKIKMQVNENREKEILGMYEDVLYNIAEITHKNIEKYKESDEKLRTTELKDLSTIAKETQERKNLVEWKPTENQNINITFN